MIFNTLEKPLFYDVEVLTKRKETDNSYTYGFTFIKNQIVTKLEFVPGQFNLLDIPGLGLYKSTIVSNPKKTDIFQHTIHYAVKNSIEYKIIEKLMEGTVIKVAGPFGNGWAKSNLHGKNLLVIAGGLGFRSARPMLDYIEHRRVLFNEVEVLYAVKTPKDFFYSYDYERWKNAKIDMKLIVENIPFSANTSNAHYKKGLIVSLLRDMKSSNEDTMVLISGSEMMIKFTINFLFKKQFSEKQIYVSLDYLLNKPDSNWVALNGPIFTLEQIKSWLI